MMGNNPQALKTAKALHKQIVTNEPYVANDDVNQVEFAKINGHSNVRRPSMSPGSVTQSQSSCHKSDSDDRNLLKKNMQDNAVFVNGTAILTDNNPSNAFIYYLPETNRLDAQLKDPRTQDKAHLEEQTLHNGGSPAREAVGTTTKLARSGASKPVVVDLTLDDSDGDNDEQDTLPKILAAYSLHGNTDLSNLINHNVHENRLKENGVIGDSLVLNTEKPDSLNIHVTTAQSINPRELVISTSNKATNHAGMNTSNLTTSNGHSTPLGASFGRINQTEHLLNRTSVTNPPSSQESIASFAGRHHNVETVVNSAGHPRPMFDVGRMNLVGHSTFPHQPNLTTVNRTSYESQLTPLSTDKYNSTARQNLNNIKNKPNGILFDNQSRTQNASNHDQNASLPMNGFRYHVSDVSRPGNVKNDVMHDVTNIQGMYSYEYRPVMLSSWDKPVDVYGTPVSTLSDSDDNVVITKVVKPTDSDKVRIKQRRKTPLAVRQWSPEEAEPVTKPDKQVKQVNAKKKSLENSLQNVAAMKQKASSIEQGHVLTEAKIQTLKNLLQKQEKAVEKLRSKDNKSPCLRTDRVLLVEIPDLKSELPISNKGEQSFRVCSQTITISPTDSESSRKRRRKRDPRKISRQEDRYPSYVEYKDSDDDDLSAAKRFKGKQKGPKSKSRGRNSPKPTPLIPVVEKDAWHRELGKAEAMLAQTDGAVDKNTFMLFLGLRKV